MSLRLYAIITFLFSVLCVSAQKTERVRAEYTYHAPENVTLEEAKRTALERAKIQAIADEFGTIVSQSNTTVISNLNGKSSSDFYSLGGSDVKGEWIETIGEPIFDISYEQNLLVINVSVEGRIREIVSASIDLLARVLCNGTTSEYEREDFRDGDDMFLEFQSPIDGYLTVYLVDNISSTAYCLLPYRQSENVVQQIEKDKRYLFFSAKKSEGDAIDEYTMTATKQIERNDLYIIFSPNSYVKANSQDAGELFPRQLSLTDFKKWLSKQRARDNRTQVIHKVLAIRK